MTFLWLNIKFVDCFYFSFFERVCTCCPSRPADTWSLHQCSRCSRHSLCRRWTGTRHCAAPEPEPGRREAYETLRDPLLLSLTASPLINTTHTETRHQKHAVRLESWSSVTHWLLTPERCSDCCSSSAIRGWSCHSTRSSWTDESERSRGGAWTALLKQEENVRMW